VTHKRPSKRTKRVQATALSKYVLPTYRSVVLVLGPVASFEQVAAIGAFAYARGLAPVVPVAARKEWVTGAPEIRDDTTPSVARALGMSSGTRAWILGPLDDDTTVAMLAFGEGFTVGRYRTPLLRHLDPEKLQTLDRDVVLGTWDAWYATIRSECPAALDSFDLPVS
jgi:hypothetical protein